MRLRDRILRAASWTVGTYGVEIAIRVLSTLIMTRLLFPEAYGQIAVSSSLLVGLALISDFGVHFVIMQSPRGETDDFLRSAWTFQFVRGTALWLTLVCVCCLISTPLAREMFRSDSVFADPHFPLVTAVLGLGLLFAGFESTALHLNARRLNQRPIFFISLISQALSLAVMIIWALLEPSVWALVGGSLAGSLARLFLSHVLVPGPSMSPRWNRKHIQEIITFGRWLVVSSVGTFISSQSDQIILGLLLPSSSLGVYSIARLLVETPLGVFNRLNASLAIPAIREILLHQPTTLRSKYYQLRLPFDILVPLIAGFLLCTGTLIVDILYDARYAQAGRILQILAVGLITYPSLLFGSVFAAAGEPRVAGIVAILQAASLIVCITVGYLIGDFSGAIWGIALHKFVPSATILILAGRKQWVIIQKEMRCLLAFLFGVAFGQLPSVLISTFGSIQLWHR